MTPVTLNPRARRELAEATLYFRGGGVDGDFRRAARAARRRIAGDPLSLPLQPGSGTVRRCRVAGFDYDLLFKVRSSGVEIVSVWHHARNPADRPG